MKYDLFFGPKLPKLMKEIRKKALIQYVTPYKVIDLREIAKAFDISVEKIESEIAELIVTKKIQAKIDSHSKVNNHLLQFPLLFSS
jgi:COP9 signalosome complex subunit 1